MLLGRLLNWLRGYVRIAAEGLFPERFINLCTRRGIALWNVRRQSRTRIDADMRLSSFRALRGFGKKTRCRVHLLKKTGLPFFLHRHRRRKPLVLGLALFVVLLYSMTMHVWVVEITGAETVPAEDISAHAEQAGLTVGMLKSRVDADHVKNYVMSAMPELAWVGVTTKGTVVTVDVRERAKTPDAFPKDQPCNIIAGASGVVETLDVMEGYPAVARGDVVYKGQLLVSGAADSAVAGIRFFHADADIRARTWHEESVELPAYEVREELTGREVSKNQLTFFGFALNLYFKDEISFENFDTMRYTNNISVGKNNVIPIGLVRTVYREKNVTKTELTPEQAAQKLMAEMDEKYKDTEIVDKKVRTEGNKLTVTYECIESIVQKEALHDNGENSGS